VKTEKFAPRTWSGGWGGGG